MTGPTSTGRAAAWSNTCRAFEGSCRRASTPTIGPDATGVGWVYQYALVDDTGRHTLADLRSFQDWYLRYWLASVPGVAEVASIGGFVKQYQVTLDPVRLAAFRRGAEGRRDGHPSRATTTSKGGCSSSRAASSWCGAAAT